MVQRIVELPIRFLVGAWLIRYLGPQQFGVYSYSLSFVLLFADVAALGMDKIVVRDLTRGVFPIGEILATSVAMRVVAALSTTILVVAVAAATEDDPLIRNAIWVLAIQLLFSPALVVDLWFQFQVDSQYVAWIRIGATAVIAAIQVVFIMSGFPLQAFLWLLVAQSALVALGLLIAFRKVGPRELEWRRNLRLATGMARDALPLLLAGLSVAVYMRIDQVMLGRLAGFDSVGAYGAAVKVSEIWYFVPMALAISVFPGIVQIRARGTLQEYQRRLQLLYDGMALYSYAVIILVLAAAPMVVQVLFGASFVGTAEILRVHVLSLVFVSMSVIFARWLVAEDLMKFSMVTTILGAIANVIFNLLLIPKYEAVGAAWATVLSYALSSYLSLVFFRPLRSAFAQQTRALASPLRLRAVIRSMAGTRLQ